MTDLPLVRVRLKYPDLDTFAERFAPNVTRGGIFLASREPRPVGSLLRFEVSLLSGAPVLTGKGKVTWTKAYDPKEPGRPYGMGVQFTELDRASRPVLDRLLKRRDQPAKPAATPPNPATAPAAPASAAPPAPERGRSETAKTPPHKRPPPLPPPLPPSVSPPPLPTRANPFEQELAAMDRIDEATLRRVIERARTLAREVKDIEELARPVDEPPPTLAQALAELPRSLGIRGAADPVH
jgi:molecular chaperone DnaK